MLVLDALITPRQSQGTAHGAEELGLCPHGLVCQAGAWGRYIRFCLEGEVVEMTAAVEDNPVFKTESAYTTKPSD
jgi:hypothetical protein